MAESESKTRTYQTVRQLAYRPISLFARLLLLFAAGMKAWQLATVPDLGEGVFHVRWFNFLVVEFEIVLGLWLLFGFLPKQTRRLTIILFTGFAGVSLYKVRLKNKPFFYFEFIFVFRLFVILSLLLCIAHVYATDIPNDKSVKKEPLMDVYKQYVKEVRSQNSVRSNKFRIFWEKEFTKALENYPNAPVVLQLCVLGELGAIQKALGTNDRALKSFDKAAQLAKANGKIGDETEALGNVFLLYYNGLKLKQNFANTQLLLESAKKLSSASSELLKENPKNTSQYFNTIYDIGYFLLEMAMNDSHGNTQVNDNKIFKEQKELLDFSEKCLRISASENNIDSNKLARRLFSLARVLSHLGQSDQAVKTYESILNLNQTDISKLWIQELVVLESEKPCSKTYMEKMKNAIKECNENNINDNYRTQLNFRLGGCYAKNNQYEDSNIFYFYAMEGASNNKNLAAYVLSLIAANYIKQGNLSGARNLYSEILNKYPNSSLANMVKSELNKLNNLNESNYFIRQP